MQLRTFFLSQIREPRHDLLELGELLAELGLNGGGVGREFASTDLGCKVRTIAVETGKDVSRIVSLT